MCLAHRNIFEITFLPVMYVRKKLRIFVYIKFKYHKLQQKYGISLNQANKKIFLYIILYSQPSIYDLLIYS